MRRDELYLLDIVKAADDVRAFLAGVQRDAFLANRLLQSAVLQKLTVVGEAAARLSASFTDKHPEIDWQDIAAFRNIAVHAYFSIQWPIVWVAAVEETPQLRKQVGEVLEQDYPGLLGTEGLSGSAGS